MNQKTLKNYAKLIARVGANVQKDQDVIINASVSDEYFVKYVVEECYKAGAKSVTVEWSSSLTTALAYKAITMYALLYKNFCILYIFYAFRSISILKNIA